MSDPITDYLHVLCEELTKLFFKWSRGPLNNSQDVAERIMRVIERVSHEEGFLSKGQTSQKVPPRGAQQSTTPAQESAESQAARREGDIRAREHRAESFVRAFTARHPIVCDCTDGFCALREHGSSSGFCRELRYGHFFGKKAE